MGKRAREAVAGRLASLGAGQGWRPGWPGYTLSPEDNLITGVDPEDFQDDLAAADGSELAETEKAPARFCAAYSSSALVVNTFAPFRRSPEALDLAGYRGFQEAEFECRCPTGLRGTSPNLDFVASGTDAVVAVESGFLEILSPKKAKFPGSYSEAMDAVAEPAWCALYRDLLDDPARFKFIDAVRLVKHYLGMRHGFRDYTGIKVLMYLYWEPANARIIPQYRQHRDEVRQFAAQVAGSEIRFAPLSYPELWEQWTLRSRWEGMSAHLDALRQRYQLSV